ncbi:hypothetical protein ALP29_201130 [Pseudomonas syringae pv. avii]|uniref:Uncharacterized protein n=1 Tax=Pseudomonas syringae pv. avii TaxID=663959 RepID=A0A3M5V031_PSESX|nr:hypothetical protein ALP29_201130 [Pseudomonas syringae pv. avii]
MVLHARFAEQLVLYEQMTTENRAAVFREGRAGQGEVAAQLFQQCLADLTDVAGGSRIEGRAILEEDLLAPALAQPFQRGEGFSHGVGAWRGARFQGNDNRIGVQPCSHLGAGDTDALHGAHAAAHQHVGQVGRAGEIVSNAAQQRASVIQAHQSLLRLFQAWLSAIRCPGKS